MENQNDQDINADEIVDTNQPPNQKNFSDSQGTVSSESEWVDEEPISGTFHSLSGQRSKRQRTKGLKAGRLRKKLQKSISMSHKSQNHCHKSKLKVPDLIQQESEAENVLELQRSISAPQQGQNPYSFHKSNCEDSNLKCEVENESDTDNLCSLNSSLSAEYAYFNSFERKNDGFLPNSRESNAYQQKDQHDKKKKGSEFYNENSGTETDDNDNISINKVDEFRKLQEKLYNLEKSLKPSDIIIDVRKEIENLSNTCIEQHLQKINKISDMMKEDSAYEPILKLHKQNLTMQGSQFDTFATNAKHDFNSFQHSRTKALVRRADNIKLQIENECHLFQRTFPAYAYKSDILSALNENQVVIVSADCSYFFNIVTPAIIQSGFPDHSIISCESNAMASEYVKGKFENIIKNDAEINYLTEDKLLNFLSEDGFSKDFVTIVNLPLKRSISVDLSLAFMRDLLSKQKDSKLILLISIFDNVQNHKIYFSSSKTFVLEVPKLLLPVKTMWKRECSKNYKEDIICTALSIHVLQETGNVLAFLPNVAEAKTAIVMFTEKLQELNYENIKCVLLEETSSISHFSYRPDPKKRTIFFATDCAEIIPIPSVRYVIDCGLIRDYMFHGQKNLEILTTTFCSRAKARLRKSLIRVYKSGICYRIYNKENFCSDMHSYERPDVLTLNPFNTIIEMFRHAPENALSLEFVEPMNDIAKCHSIKLLRNFNAVKNGNLTHLGKKMIKLPLPPRYSKLIFQGIDWGYAYEAVILAAYFSVDLFLFKHSKDEDVQRVIDAAKLDLIQYESDALSFLSIYKTWMQNQYSMSWCEEFYINWETLHEVKQKVSEICQYTYEYANENIYQEFNENDDSALDLTKILLHSFGDHFCVFSGHCRSGYRILSSSQTAFRHSSSIICNNDSLPQFIIFNKMICDQRNFLIGITAIPPDLVHNSLTDGCDKILEYDYSDIFERTLVRKTIEPVNERMMQILLSKKGGKLLEIEDFIKKDLKTEYLIIEPVVEKECVNVYALEFFSDSAMKRVDQILKSNIDDIINAEQTYILKLEKGEMTVPLEVKCVMGAKITSVKVKDSLLDTKRTNLVDTSPCMKYSLSLTWIRRPCNGICYIDFAENNFNEARAHAIKKFCVMDCKVHVDVSQKADNQLLCTGVPCEARVNDVEEALKRYLPGIEVTKIEMLYSPPFKTTNKDLEVVEIEIQDFCEEYTDLSDFDIVVPKHKDTDTMMTVYINVFCTEDLTETVEQLSNILINDYKIYAKPVYQSVINVNIKTYKALKSHLVEEIGTLKAKLCETYSLVEPFFVDYSIHKDFVQLNLLANDIQIMKKLQRTINELLEGEVLNNSTVKDIEKLFSHGGRMWLRTLERSKAVAILEECSSKIIRIYGSKENCFKVKRCILNFLEDIESETILLNDDKNNKITLKSVIKQYGVHLECFVEACGLLTAVLNIKSNQLLLHGSRESIIKAKGMWNKLFKPLDSAEEFSFLSGEEKCPVCGNTAFNKTFRLQHCDHQYCNECILALVTQANFPIQCCAENCFEDIVLDDIVRIFDGDHEKFKKLLHSSLEDYLKQNRKDIVYCPAPGCSMFFFRKDVSGRWECPLCRNQICMRCNVVYHYGYGCDVIQGSRKDPDDSYKAWKKRTIESKNCPKCKNTIEKKDDDCYHMTCLLCKANFCWFCLREFRTASEVYNHIPFCEKCPKL